MLLRFYHINKQYFKKMMLLMNDNYDNTHTDMKETKKLYFIHIVLYCNANLHK